METIRVISLLTIALVLSGCTSFDKDGVKRPYDVEHPIIGSWSFDMNGCIETYEFLPNGIRNSTSAEELVQATYVIAAKPSGYGFYKITDTVVKDNGKRDCSGSTRDMTGDVVDLYVKFNPQMDQIVFCLDESPNRCFGPFRKNIKAPTRR
jgi:hypothetical protein